MDKPRWQCSYELATGKTACILRGHVSDHGTVTPDAARLSRMRRRIWSWSEAVHPVARRATVVFVTLTYADPDAWEPRHVSGYLKRLREHLRRRGQRLLGYAWVLELQKRGAPHYHLILLLPRGCRVPMPDKSGHWRFGWSNVQRARHFGGVRSYLSKYLSKGVDIVNGDHDLPPRARIFAVSIRRDLPGLLRRPYLRHRLTSYPGWLALLVSPDTPADCLPKRVPRVDGGGFMVYDVLFGEYEHWPPLYYLILECIT